MLFPQRIMSRFQRRQCVVSTEDNVWFPQRTMCGCHTGQCVVSTQDNVSFPNRTMCRVQTRQCVFSKQDNVCFPNKTMCASQTGQCMLPKQEKSKDGSDFDDFLTKTIGAPSKKIDHAETTAPKRPRRNVRAETSAPKRPRRNAHDEDFSGRNIFRRPYVINRGPTKLAWCFG